jgi:hypothetical protein
MASVHPVASGLPVLAAELLEVFGVGGAGTADGAVLLAATPTALQLLQEREIVARTPGKCDPTEDQRQAGAAVAEPIGPQEQGCAGLAGHHARPGAEKSTGLQERDGSELGRMAELSGRI